MLSDISGYQKVNYKQFILSLKDAFDKAGKPYADLMKHTGKGASTVQNIFQVKKQKVPDKVLDQAAEALKFDCVIALHSGKKHFYIAKDA